MDRGSGTRRRASATARDLAISQRIMAVLGAVLVVAGLVELLLDGWVWLYPVHIGAGILALLAAPFRRLAKPAALLLGALFLFLYVFEAANPAGAGDVARPSSNATLILTGVVLVAVMVALLWPNTYSGRAEQDGRNHE